ncbi:hypothetical protein [Streptomyces sp. LMG1-1-1.1]|uniref:hypothetical protein n=1 Tax=Streptomyces sp. LMG1-1-1.1 TaxID=3135245 RepID=UPI003467C95F
MSKSARPGAVVAVVLAALSVSCGTADRNDASGPTASSPANATAMTGPAATPATPTGPAVTPATPAPASPTVQETDGPAAEAGATGDSPDSASGSESGPPELVRDAFAGLQATQFESCDATADCSHVLARVYDELTSLDRAMKADPQGPGHFAEPIGRIQQLDGELEGDRSLGNLKKHQSLLIGTRDRINAWMQGHPEDYR